MCYKVLLFWLDFIKSYLFHCQAHLLRPISGAFLLHIDYSWDTFDALFTYTRFNVLITQASHNRKTLTTLILCFVNELILEWM